MVQAPQSTNQFWRNNKILNHLAFGSIVLCLSLVIYQEATQKQLAISAILPVLSLLFAILYRKEIPRVNNIMIALSIFILWSFVSVLWSDNLAAIHYADKYVLGLMLAWSIYILGNLDRKLFQKLVLFFALVGIALLSLCWYKGAPGRLEVGQFNPNQIASFFSISALCFSFLFFKTKKRLLKILYLVSAVFMFASVLFSGSRGATMGLAVGLITLLFYIKKLKVRRYNIWLMTLVTISMSVLLLIGTKTLNRNLSGTLNDRKAYLSSAMQMFIERPVFGYGFGSYKTIGISYQKMVTTNSKHSHASIAQVLAETGIIGFGLLAFLYYEIFKKMKNHIKISKTFSYVDLYFLCLIVISLQALVDIQLELTSFVFIYCVFISLIAVEVTD